jgi:hypothetical protein
MHWAAIGARQTFRLTHASAKCQYLTCQMRLLRVQSGLRKSAIAVIAGHAVERAARHSKVCWPNGRFRYESYGRRQREEYAKC